MRIEGLNNPNFVFGQNMNQDYKVKDASEDFSKVLNTKQATTSIEIPKVMNNSTIQNYAEYYLKAGRSYENLKSYRQAVAAYEQANIVKPDISSANHADNIKKTLSDL